VKGFETVTKKISDVVISKEEHQELRDKIENLQSKLEQEKKENNELQQKLNSRLYELENEVKIVKDKQVKTNKFYEQKIKSMREQYEQTFDNLKRKNPISKKKITTIVKFVLSNLSELEYMKKKSEVIKFKNAVEMKPIERDLTYSVNSLGEIESGCSMKSGESEEVNLEKRVKECEELLKKIYKKSNKLLEEVVVSDCTKFSKIECKYIRKVFKEIKKLSSIESS
jgi:hypothetical protein